MAKAAKYVAVFISSKQSEFELERRDIAGIIERLPLFAPVLAEHWTPGRQDVESRYLEDVRSSPIYVGLFGRLYSRATELEYRAAAENPHRPLLIYIRECAGIEPELRILVEFLKQQHTVKVYDDWAQVRPDFARHMWDTVQAIVQAYHRLASAEASPRGEESVMARSIREERRWLTSLGLPGADSQEGARNWATSLGRMLGETSMPL